MRGWERDEARALWYWHGWAELCGSWSSQGLRGPFTDQAIALGRHREYDLPDPPLSIERAKPAEVAKAEGDDLGTTWREWRERRRWVRARREAWAAARLLAPWWRRLAAWLCSGDRPRGCCARCREPWLYHYGEPARHCVACDLGVRTHLT